MDFSIMTEMTYLRVQLLTKAEPATIIRIKGCNHMYDSFINADNYCILGWIHVKLLSVIIIILLTFLQDTKRV